MIKKMSIGKKEPSPLDGKSYVGAMTSTNMTGADIGKKALRLRADEAAAAEREYNKQQKAGGIKGEYERNARTSQMVGGNEKTSSAGLDYKRKLNALGETSKRVRNK